MRRILRLLTLPLLLLSSALAASEATVLPPVLEPAGTGGYAALDRALGKLATHRRLLVIGAHPDDEDTSALAYVSRALDGEAAYLSLSRGEGGQNLIGPDLGEALGVLRTRELLAARGIDGGRQYFTRAFDFGYTRSRDETLRRWPEADLLEDAVRVIRRFKPQVILSIFGNDSSGGHGQHQAAGHTAFLAFARSADAKLLAGESAPSSQPWKASSLYRSGWFEPESAKVTVELGVVDPWSGYSILQIAQKSRAQHSSQDMGRLLDVGKRENRYRFVEGAGSAAGTDLFAGVDTSLAGIAATLGESPAGIEVRRHLLAASEAAKAARSAVRPERLDVAIEPLLVALAELDAARDAARTSATPAAAAVAELITEKVAIGEQALLLASGIALDAQADDETLVAGSHVPLTWTIWNSGSHPLELVALGFSGFVEWAAEGGGFEPALEGSAVLAAGESRRFTRKLSVRSDAPVTRPYFLERPRLGDLYDWSAVAAEVKDEPFAPAPLRATFELRIGGTGGRLGRMVRLEREVVYRFADQARGEIRRPLRIVPPLEVQVSPEVVVWPAGAKAPEVEVRLASRHGAALSGTISFTGGCTGRSSSAQSGQSFELGARDATTLHLAVPACAPSPKGGAGNGRSRFSVVAEAAGMRSAASAPVLTYAHVPPTPLRGNDAFDLVRAEIALPAVRRVGYVLGASDRVPGLLSAIGVPLDILDADELSAMAANDFGRFDAIVIGSRAYETDAALQRANARLLDYARQGGLLIVQYQQYPFIDGGYAPYPMRIERPHDRITDESSPVVLLAPEHAVFTSPNRLSEKDWQGWAQERALYMPATWDALYEPLIELQDPNEPARRGGLLVAPLGEGTYVYTGIAFFRQLPAGVPGAFRLFANLLGLGSSAAERSSALLERGRDLAERFLVVDTHIDVPYRLHDEMEDISERTAKGDFDYPRAVAGGLDVTFMSIYVPASFQETGGAKALADELIDMVEAIARKAPEKWSMAATPDQALANRAVGKLSFAMGIENGAAIEDNLTNLQHFFDRGVRYVTLTHGKNNLICDSSYEKPENRRWRGLSPFGREVVAEMNRLGILVDLSHVSDEAFDQALALSKAPTIASHSSCRHFTPGFERNVDDQRIRALAAKGGVLQINFGSSFLTQAANENALERFAATAAFVKQEGVAEDSPEANAFEEKWKKENPLPRATLDDVVAHFDHVVKLVGIDHVGLGSDFDGVGDSLPEGLKDVSMYPNLFARLLARGYSDSDIEKIAGGNLMRVWREAERVAKELQGGS